MSTRFWLTYDREREEYVRRGTGDSLGELAEEAHARGHAWHLVRGRGGMWFIFNADPRDLGRGKRSR